MATAKKTKSGKWRVLVFDYKDRDGKRHYKSFTADSKRKAEKLALDYQLNGERGEPSYEDMTFGRAFDRYIEAKSALLSPATIRGYKRMKQDYLKTIEDYKLSAINTNVVQVLINELTARLSAKTVRNVHSCVHAVLKMFAPQITLHTQLPRKVKPEYIIPTAAEVQKLLDAAPPKAKVPIMLAAYGSLRRSEISALTLEDVSDTGITINKAAVYDENGDLIIKTTKTEAGKRFVPLPQFVISALRDWTGFGAPPATISIMFDRARDKADVPHFTFHKLRHYWASELHAQGIPDKYICEVGGWESVDVLHQVYQHTLRDKQNDMQNKIVSIFDKPQEQKTTKKQA